MPPRVDEKKGILRICDEALRFFFPPVCLCCAEKLGAQEEHFCDHCRGELDFAKKPFCPSCGAPLGRTEPKDGRCEDCPAGEIFFDRAFAPLMYRDPIAEAIKAFKFQGRIELDEPFGRILFYFLQKELPAAEFDAIIPAPLHFLRRLKRGYNQAERLAAVLSKLSGIPVWGEALRRTRRTPPQSRLERNRRRDNVRGAFAAAPSDEIRGSRLLLIDDVFTTGSTMNACAEALKERGANRVTVLTLARASLL